ncbi:ABC transporter ATP-binding protein [Bosea sp. CS1GBMeth4]|uniref:ABC transporter ATP-binding protein n=1 Tax=Bosea sp. CS1GBMeth4 TaxID=1892849 RepID=UPI001FCEF0C5|nr:ABC transporter ATP-binding protein [Bosea sp. CS1GBMeth4]
MNVAGLAAAPVLALRGITKRFGALTANCAVDLTLHRGEIVALLGENGAGKTTLMNILFGHYLADEGEVLVATPEGELKPLPQGSPQAALDAGIGMVHQHFTLAENLTGFENIVLGLEPLLGLAHGRRAMRRTVDALMARTGLCARLDIRVAELGVGERQRIEILKALSRRTRILVLDEPTAVLTPQEAEGLFVALRALAASGLGIVFISHKLDEVLALSQRLVVLRAGRKVADRPTAGADRALIAKLMVGEEVEVERPAPAHPGSIALELMRVSAGSGRTRLIDATLTLRQGEILGIAGVSGNGQSSLAGLVAGLLRPESGTITVLGRQGAASPAERRRDGVGRLAEDRHRDGMVGDMTVSENLVIERRGGMPFSRLGLLRPKAIRAAAQDAIASYDIRCPGPDAPLRLLSGGNIQKLLLARALAGSPHLILASQPTRGLDVGATVSVHRRLREAAGAGAAVLLISEDLDELFALSHRIAVIHGGRLTPAADASGLSTAEIGLAMAGEASSAFGALA